MKDLVAITGGTGFIGSELIRLLKADNFRVKALVRKQSIHKLPQDLIDQTVPGSMSDDSALQELVRDADLIINCAGDVRGTSKGSFLKTNVAGICRLALNIAKSNPKSRLLHISSLAAKNPHLSHYSFSKLRSEKVLQEMSRSLQWTVFRPPVVYGPGDKEVIPLFKWIQLGYFPVIGREKNRFSLIHVHDLARAVLSWIYCKNCLHKTYELDDGKEKGYSWKEIAQNLSILYNKKVKLFHLPIPIIYACAYFNLSFSFLLKTRPMLTPGKVRELTNPDWTCSSFEFSQDTGWYPEIDFLSGCMPCLNL